jgi:hypothetical protein
MNNATDGPYPPSNDSLLEKIERLEQALHTRAAQIRALERQASRKRKWALRRPPRRRDAR